MFPSRGSTRRRGVHRQNSPENCIFSGARNRALSVIIPGHDANPARAPQPAPAFQPPRSIAIEGPIRVGKSTLARVLADRLHARRLFDPRTIRSSPISTRKRPGGLPRADVFPDRAPSPPE